MINKIILILLLQTTNGISIINLKKNKLHLKMKHEDFQYHPRSTNQNNYYNFGYYLLNFDI